MTSDLTPVLIGGGQETVRDEPLDALSTPLDLIERSARRAADDAGLAHGALAGLDALVVVKSFREPMRNTPEALARRIGATDAQRWLAPDGGNGPQQLVNEFATRLAQGKCRFVLLAGAEAMDNGRRLIKATGNKPDWAEPSDHDPEWIHPPLPMWTEHERRHGIWLAASVYPLFENALRGSCGHSIEAHQRSMGELFAPFSAIAAQTAGAWLPVARSAEEIATPTERNRFVGWPYTKYMNAMNQVNQGAALLLTTVGEARRLGVDPERCIYLHGAAEATERGFVSDRVNYHESPAIRAMGKAALAMANAGIDEVAHLDLYSCFPSAVAIARDALGIAATDRRALTVTGGLPYHGGAGNNYVMNAIVSMMARLRADRGALGMVTANGGYLSKHAAGLYSTTPVQGAFERPTPAAVQASVNDADAPPLDESPAGRGTIETYTVMFGRDNRPAAGLVVGRLDRFGPGRDSSTPKRSNPEEPGSGAQAVAPRFLAVVPPDQDLLTAMTREDFLGHGGTVSAGETNTFSPD